MLLSTFMLVHEDKGLTTTLVFWLVLETQLLVEQKKEQGDICTLLDSFPLFLYIRMEISYSGTTSIYTEWLRAERCCKKKHPLY